MKNTTNPAEIPVNQLDTSIKIKLPTTGWGFHNNPLDEANAAVNYSTYYLDAVLHFIGLGIAATEYEDKQCLIDRPKLGLNAQNREHFQNLIEIGKSINSEISEYMGAFDAARDAARSKAEAQSGESESLAARESPEDSCVNLAKEVNAAIFRSNNPDFSISTQHKILGILGDAMKEKQIEWSPELVEALLCNVDDDGETANKLTQIINGGSK